MTTLYHTELSNSLTKKARYALLPGDPGRVPSLAHTLDPKAKPIAHHREYCSYLAHVQGQPVIICSTGIGGSSAAIAIEELATVGVENFIRIGTCGAIQPEINFGDVVISQGAVRIDGTSDHYAPIEYPAVADLSLTQSILTSAQVLSLPHHLGITASSASFYPGQERNNGFNQYVPQRFQGSMAEWQKLGVLNFEMEAATILTLAKVFGLRAACFCGVVAKRTESESIRAEQLQTALPIWEQLAKQTLITHLEQT